MRRSRWMTMIERRRRAYKHYEAWWDNEDGRLCWATYMEKVQEGWVNDIEELFGKRLGIWE